MLPRFPPRVRQALIIAVGLISVYYFIFGGLRSSSVPLSTLTSDLKPDGWNPELQDAYAEFSRSLVKLLKDTKPPVASLTRTGAAGAISFSDNINVSLQRPDLVSVGTSEVKLMRKAHKSLIDQALAIPLPYNPGTRGIVSTAGGSHIPVFIISLRMLRRTGSTLPVELFLRADEGHDAYLCEELLPALNARCVILDDFLKPAKSIQLEKYQYKIFSILFSSFEEVLLLDADNFPVKDPAYVFDTEPFTSYGMITWPDFWISTAAANFYTIQGTLMPSTNVRASTESGQIFVTKRTHSAGLLVAAYYNFYGPSHYYPLLTQGGPGEGDKETFIAGASAVGAPFYQVSDSVGILGYSQRGELKGVAMLQHDPIDDYNGVAKPAPFSVHANFPKMDPNGLFGAESPVIDARTGKHHRLWETEKSVVETFGKDLERPLWEEIRYVACMLGGVFANWKAEPAHAGWKGTCEKVEDHMDIIFPLKDSEI